MHKDKIKQLEDLKSKVKNPEIVKSIEEKLKYVNKPIQK
jgi:predicted ATP-grasp superfamily ATP-dependent carboligase